VLPSVFDGGEEVTDRDEQVMAQVDEEIALFFTRVMRSEA